MNIAKRSVPEVSPGPLPPSEPPTALTYAYDGSVLTGSTWAGTVAGSVSRVYDNNFRITSQSVNGANSITFGYDQDSLLTSAGALAITRDPQYGLITGSTLGVVADSRTYNPFGEMDHATANVSGSPVLDVQYTRDDLGRITQKVETIQGSRIPSTISTTRQGG